MIRALTIRSRWLGWVALRAELGRREVTVARAARQQRPFWPDLRKADEAQARAREEALELQGMMDRFDEDLRSIVRELDARELEHLARYEVLRALEMLGVRAVLVVR